MRKIEKLMRIDFESKPVYGDDDKYIKIKIKIYADSMITNCCNKKMPKEKSPCKCLSIIMLHSVIKANKKYHPQTFLEKCKYVQEKTKTENYIDEVLEKIRTKNFIHYYIETFLPCDNCFYILLVFVFFLLTYCGICFFHILSFYLFLL